MELESISENLVGPGNTTIRITKLHKKIIAVVIAVGLLTAVGAGSAILLKKSKNFRFLEFIKYYLS
jgi:hypothetical protein